MRQTHGLSHISEYNIWKGMKQRCSNPSHPRWMLYGGRGIQVCQEWIENFSIFLRDVGPRPSMLHSLDRINPNGNYEKDNIRWATQEQQNRNKRKRI